MATSPRRQRPQLNDHVPRLDGESWREAYDAICDNYRLALLNALYCGKRRGQMENWNLAFEIVIAVGTVISAGLIAQKVDFVPSAMPPLFAMLIAAIAATKPVLRLAARGGKYAGQEGGFRGIYFDYRHLVEDIRLNGRVTQVSWQEHIRLRERYESLAVTGDPNPSMKLRTALREDVERQLPVESLRIP
ncbi:MAG: hypothetical protein KIS73_28850 [Enhydrobacter sp.]|nr:hypothetical protein [Enhydrobacter sp.]